MSITPEQDAIIKKSEKELFFLCLEYECWQKENNLSLGSADEHWFDENLSEKQRRWLMEFSDRWNEASIIWKGGVPVQGRDAYP